MDEKGGPGGNLGKKDRCQDSFLYVERLPVL